MTIKYVAIVDGDAFGPFDHKIEGRSFLHRTTGSITGGILLMVRPPHTVPDGDLREGARKK